ncbi:hypothetical protein yc1106_06409 [Curvularia clavata]|uniref:Uncharacterized protein n=1 Tax=Curvularia clavata TaxID=95742 RepID=A0A9Q9DUM0_CURCL|nr:hypothetical protein yc1106_06409 [Curvularia clavata]
MVEAPVNESNKAGTRSRPGVKPENKKAPMPTRKKLPRLGDNPRNALYKGSVDGQFRASERTPRNTTFDGPPSAGNSPSPSTHTPNHKPSSASASWAAVGSKLVRKPTFVPPIASQSVSPTESSPSPASRHQQSAARRASSASAKLTPERPSHRLSLSKPHNHQKRLSIVRVKDNVDHPKGSDYRSRAHSLAPIPDHLEQPPSPELVQIPIDSGSESPSAPKVTTTRVRTSIAQLTPSRNSFEHATSRQISNAVGDLEDMVQEAVDAAKNTHDRNQVEEIYGIIEGAKNAIQEASAGPVHLMATATPLKASSSSSPSSGPYHAARSPVVEGNVLEDVAPNRPEHSGLHRASVSHDWAYSSQEHTNKEHSSIPASALNDRANEQDNIKPGPSNNPLLPKHVKAAPREHVDFVLRPIGRDESRGRSRQRATNKPRADRNPRSQHKSLKRVHLSDSERSQKDSDASANDVSSGDDHPTAKAYGNELTLRGQMQYHTFDLRRPHRRQPIARNWYTLRKRLTATIACINTALLGIIVGIYAGEVPRIQYSLADEQRVAIVGNAVLFAGLAISTFFAWPLPLLHGRKPYILSALATALPLQFPQAIVVSGFGDKNPVLRVGLLLARTVSGLVLGFANVNYITVLLDLFGASLQSKNPHQEFVVANDVRRHGGGMGIWLGIWSWCWIGSIAVGFQIGAAIIERLPPQWGFYIVVIILLFAMVLNIIAPETRRAQYRKSVTEVYDKDENFITRRVNRGEVKLHISTEGPKSWFDEMWAGVKLMIMMLCQPGFFVLALYLGWIYAQVVLVIVLLGALLSRDYRWKSSVVGAGVMSVAIGALLAIPMTKAGIFSRSRKRSLRTDSMTFEKQITWTSHFVRRGIFTLVLPLVGMAYTISSAGRPKPYIVPIIFAGAIGFLSILAIAECHGLVMETFDTCDLQPGVNTKHRLQSMAVQDRRRRTNYSSFPRVTAGIFISQVIAFILAAVATIVGGTMTRNLGAQTSTAATAGVLLGLTILLILVVLRFKSVQVIPNHTFGTRRDTAAWEEFKDLEKMGRGSDWKAVVIGNPSGKFRRMNVLELGALSRWTEIRKLNFLIKGVMLGQPKEKKKKQRDSRYSE